MTLQSSHLRNSRSDLTVARQHAASGRFGDFLALCRKVAESHRDDLTAQLDLGGLLSSYGFLTEARNCYEIAQSPAGPITPLDILYGHGAALAAGHHYMAHKCGFTLKTLTQALHAAGFATSAGKRRLRGLDLWVVASKGPMEEAALRELAGKVLPG